MNGYIWGAITECEDHIYSLRSIFAGIKEEAEKERIARIQAQKELAALREKLRWRKQGEEPAPNDDTVVLVSNIEGAVTVAGSEVYAPNISKREDIYWMPLDLPEEEKK